MEIILYIVNIILILNIHAIQSDRWYRGDNIYNLTPLTQMFIALDITLLVYFQQYYFLTFLFILFISKDIYFQEKRKRLYNQIAKIIDKDNSQNIFIEDIAFDYNPQEFNVYYKIKHIQFI